jgi:hypothetical protein
MRQSKGDSITKTVFTLLLCLATKIYVDAENVIASSTEAIKDRPLIHTFFHRIDPKDRTTGMSDEDDAILMEFWKQTWYDDGWEPIVLTLEDAQKHVQYESLKVSLENLQLGPVGNLLFFKWMAMASAGGGWYADYDVFPLRDFPKELPFNGTMTVYDIIAPTLASGREDEWLLTLNALVDDAKDHKSSAQGKRTFWTDSLGVISLMGKHGKKSPTPRMERYVAHPYDKKDPIVTSSDCGTKAFKDKWVVLFGQEMLQAAQFVPPGLRLPKHRVTLARDWLPQWNATCM